MPVAGCALALAEKRTTPASTIKAVVIFMKTRFSIYVQIRSITNPNNQILWQCFMLVQVQSQRAFWSEGPAVSSRSGATRRAGESFDSTQRPEGAGRNRDAPSALSK